MTSAPFDSNSLSDTLKQYYKRLFPFKPYFEWLNYDESFQNREFCFVLSSDAYLRFKSFKNQLELEKEIQELLPVRIELGAIYNFPPKDGRNKPNFSAVERELVFDIDLTDYDDVRKCCTADGMCTKCWKFVVIAVKLLDAALDKDFGFDHRLWVYSGRRGIHCWVCDAAARKLTQEARSAIADYLSIVTGGEHKAKKVSLPGDYFHPSIKRALDIIVQDFPRLAETQGWFDDTDACKPFLDLLSQHAELLDAVTKDIQKQTTGLDRARAIASRMKNKGYSGVNKLLCEAVLQMAYPRLDVGVTKTVNHLLKTPFSVHPKTGKISVPVDIKAIDKFDPEGVPRVDLLYNELLNQYGGIIAAVAETDTNSRKFLDYKRTSMAPHVRVFEEFVSRLKNSTKDQMEVNG